ncbi:MAG: hypothetical protein AAFZ65_15605, partial [Planctomycetota bacterium]
MLARLLLVLLFLAGLVAALLLSGGDPDAPPAVPEAGEVPLALPTELADAPREAEHDRAQAGRTAVGESPAPTPVGDPAPAAVAHRVRVAVTVDDEPAGEVQVEAFCYDDEGFLDEVVLAPERTDSSGSAEFELEDPRVTRVRVRGSGPGLVTAARWARLERDQPATAVRLSLKRGAMLTGRVLDT